MAGEERFTVTQGVKSEGHRRAVRQGRWAGITFLALLLVCLVAGSAIAEPGSEDSLFSSEQLAQALEQESEPLYQPSTDPEAAEELPHRDLERAEALDLLQSVFGSVLQAPAGMYDELDVEEFHSDHVAVVDAGEPALLESILPLRTEDSAGNEHVVDLDLEGAGGGLQPVNPLVEVEIPQQADEAISLPETGVEIELVGAPDQRSPSIVADSTAVYPSVATDTDFTVAPTATGLETFTHLRSPDAPLSQTFELTLPPDSSLNATAEGGAEVVKGGETILAVLPPHAFDAEGASVPVTLTVSGDAITLHVSPSEDAKFPILVDPMYETYFWSLNKHADGTEDWVGASSSSLLKTKTVGNYGEYGLNIYSYAGSISPGSQANWNYHVPRYASDYASLGVRPSSYIKKLTFTDLRWWIEESKPFKEHPFLMMGLWDENVGWWVSLGTRNGFQGELFDQSYQYNLVNPNDNKDIKSGGIAMATFESQSRPRHLLIGQASVEVTDQDYPGFGKASGPGKWMNETATDAIDFKVSDNGLGIYGMLAKYPKAGGGIKQTSQNVGCFGNAGHPCPRTWDGGFWNYNPKEMPQGENFVEMIGQDPIGHFSDQAGLQAYALVKVDHTAPSLALSGSLTEQGKIGTTASQYTLKYDATDGTALAPQSGVVSTEVKVDGTLVESKYAPGCSTKNCSVSREWTLKASDYGTGQHTVQVTTTDGVGLSTSKSLTITTVKDTTVPQLTANSAFFTAPEGWLEQKSYSYSASGSDVGGYGVTSLVLKIDGNVVKSETQSCANGGCGASISGSINMATYEGGAHPAELVATDAGGNTAKNVWTINVSPGGEIATSEAVKTLEAVDHTVGQDIPNALEGLGEEEEPSLTNVGDQLAAVDTNVPMQIEVEGGGTFTVEPAGLEAIEGIETGDAIETPPESLTIHPVDLNPNAGNAEAENGEAAVVSNSFMAASDSVVRPIYNGALTFQSIREPTAPTEYSWVVDLAYDQYLEAIDSQHAQVFYDEGHLAFTITVVPAHDAVGTEVPTSLTVSEGNIITFHVQHQGANFVYPVVSGAGWEGGFTTHSVEMPPSEQLPEASVVVESVSAPEPVSYEEAGIEEFPVNERSLLWSATASGGPRRRHMVAVQCPYLAALDSGYFTCGNPWKNEPPGLDWNAGIRSTYIINHGVAVWHKGGSTNGLNCADSQWGGPNSTLQVWEVECNWKHKQSTSSRSWISSRGDWHAFMIDTTPPEDRGYWPILSQMFRNGDRRSLGKRELED